MRLCCRIKSAWQVLGASDVEKLRLHAESPRCLLHFFPLNLVNWVTHIEEASNSCEFRKQFSEKLGPFRIYFDVVVAESCDIPARACKASDEARFNRIATGRHHYRNGLRRILCRQSGGRPPR